MLDLSNLIFRGDEGLASCVTGGSIGDALADFFPDSADSSEVSPLDGDYHFWARFTVALICGTCASLMIASVIFYLWWLCRTERKEERYERTLRLDRLINELVMHFFPAVAVEGYRFKGMRRSECGARLDFEELGLTLKANDKTVLQGVTGSIGRGKMAAIMGPSGCGKTTFMNTLCGKSTYGSMSGQVCVNGEPSSASRLEHIMGFVPQDDVVHENLTVREQIEFSAKLRNEHTLTRGEINAIVEDVLLVLQIGHIQRSVVGNVERRGISGGQRKRVNIGLELAACPALLFLDEPTSGLDSTSSLMIANALKKMTDLGMTIVMVIHQPRYSLFTLFDQVLLLGLGGRTVYLGDPEGAVSYFEGHGFQRNPMDNPADWLMDVISGEVVADNVSGNRAETRMSRRDQLADLWRNSPQIDAASTADDARTSTRWTAARRTSREMLEGVVSEEWDSADVDSTGCLTRHELRGLLQGCMDHRVETAALDDLVAAVYESQGSSSADPCSLLYKDDFRDFVRAKFETMRDELTVDYSGQSSSGSPSRIRGSGSPSKVLDTRIPPGRFRQFLIVSHRSLIQFWRDWALRVFNIALIVLAAAVFALNERGNAGQLGEVTICHMGLAMVISVSVLPTFADRPILWRDASTGMSITSLYFARICVSLIDASFLTILYAFVYWLCVKARCHFYVYMFPCMCLGWAAAAWGYLISVTASPRNSTLLTLVIMMILTQVIGNPSLVVDHVGDPSILDLLSVSPTRWSVPMQFTLYHEGGRGFHDPPLPDCSDLVDGRCPPAAGVGSGPGLRATPRDARRCDEDRKTELEKYILSLVKAQQTRLSYDLLASHATWREDGGVPLIISGILLHLVALLLLPRQSPAASSLAGSTLSGLSRGRLFRPAQPHTCSDGRDSSSGVRQNTLHDLEAASDPSPPEAESGGASAAAL